MPDNIHEMSRAIGSLESTVKTLTTTWAEQDREATEGRRLLHNKIDELKSQQATLAAQVAQQTSKLAEVEPAIKRFEAQRQRAEGARSIVKIIWAGAIAFATGIGYAAHELLIFFWPPKH